MRFIRYWILKQVTILLIAYLIDFGYEAEARDFSHWLDVIMPKVKSGQLKFR